MKFLPLVALLFTFSIGFSQSLPIDFEAEISPFDFVDFDGGVGTIVDNPQTDTTNISAKVGQIIRDGGQIFAGSSIDLAENLDFTTLNSISMKVYTTAPIGTTVKFKLEGNGTTERDVFTTVTNAWEDLTWDFTGEPSNFNSLVLMFDFGNIGDGSASSTFYFDEISQNFGGTHIDLPVDFEGTDVNYTVSDFGGNVSSLAADPTKPNNTVIQSIKTSQAATWAGTTIGTQAGFASDIPLTLAESEMSIRVWSPQAGIPVRLKVEDSNDPTHTCETEAKTTLAGEWEYLNFDFNNEADGTETLSVGLSMGWTYNMASVFFNFGTDGATAGEQTYFFDDVKFGAWVVSTSDLELTDVSISPNPSNDQWVISSTEELLTKVQLFDIQGKLVLEQNPNEYATIINATNLAQGVYISRIFSKNGTRTVRLLKN